MRDTVASLLYQLLFIAPSPLHRPCCLAPFRQSSSLRVFASTAEGQVECRKPWSHLSGHFALSRFHELRSRSCRRTVRPVEERQGAGVGMDCGRLTCEQIKRILSVDSHNGM
jgi:hypothetical protein